MKRAAEFSDPEWLDAFVGHWHLLADLSFSDLLLWLPDLDGEVFTCVAQVRPATGPTALEDDVMGEVIASEPDHPVTVAFLSQELAETSDHQLDAGIPVDVWAIPVMRGGRCIAVLERHTNRMGIRATGSLEENYLEAADVLTRMVMAGNFPMPQHPDQALAPKVGDGILRVLADGVIEYASPNAITAFRRVGALGDIMGESFEGEIGRLRSAVESFGQTVMSDLRAGQSVTFDIDQPRAVVRFAVLPLRLHGESQGLLAMCRDITELRRRDRMLVTKDAIISEIHHRVKNNLQTVAALLRMQSRRLTTPEGKEALRDANRRVSSIALVHDTLSHSIDDHVDFDEICDRVLRMIGDLAATSGDVKAKRVGHFGTLPAGIITSLSMILTELCQNAVEHGLDAGAGTVLVVPQRSNSELLIDVLDDGRGLPPDFVLGEQDSLGLAIISTLIEDLRGELTLQTREDAPGTKASVWLPLPQINLAQ